MSRQNRQFYPRTRATGLLKLPKPKAKPNTNRNPNGYQSTRHTVISSHGHVVTRSTRHQSTHHTSVSSHSQLVTSEHIRKPTVVIFFLSARRSGAPRNGWCYFPSVGTEIKCNNSLFSVRTDGNLYAYIRYFPSVGTENYS